MPQFDVITFFTQIFWLTIIFFGFYFITLQSFIPKIAAVIKARKKKLLHGAGDVSSLSKEQNSINFQKAESLGKYAGARKAYLGNKVGLAKKWAFSESKFCTVFLTNVPKAPRQKSLFSYYKTFGDFFFSTSYVNFIKKS